MTALGDRSAALVLLLLSLYTIAAARDMSYMRGRIPGPGFAPFWIGLALAIASVAILVEGFRQPKRVHYNGEGASSAVPRSHVVAVPAATIAAVALITPLGMLTALALMLMLMTRLLGAAWRTSLVTAVALPTALHVVFGMWLKVPLPRGPWGF